MFERKGVQRCFATLGLLVAALVPLEAKAQRAELDKIIQRKVLPNGLEVIVVENHGVPLVTVEIDVKNGSFTQSPEYEGLAHMYEHMFFKANSAYAEPNQFWDALTNVGAQFNAQTREEIVNYFMTVPSDKLGDAVRLLAAAVRSPLFRGDELAQERQVVISEYDRDESNPVFGFTRQLDSKLYPGNFSRKDIIGDRNVVQTTTPEKMRVIQQKYYIPNNSALIVAGDVTPAPGLPLGGSGHGTLPPRACPFFPDPIPGIPALPRSDAGIF